MMFNHDADEPVLTLTDDESWGLLGRTSHGRLATAVGNTIDIFPVNFGLLDKTIYLRTGPGEKLAALTVHDAVAFEADGILSDEAWSVVVHGKAHQLQTSADIEVARSSGVSPWIPTQKESWVKIEVTNISGRHFRLGAQPEAD